MKNDSKKKILIIAGGLQIGGAERVAANICRYAPDGEYEFHYIVFEGNENVYGAEIEQCGGKVFTLPPPSSGYKTYIKTLGNLIDEYKYAAVHSHTMFNSGINLAVAKAHGVPVRIAHSHTTRTETKVSVIQKLYEIIMKLLILSMATHLFACGIEAGEWLFGKKAFTKKGVVMRNGIDANAFKWSEENRRAIREKYGIKEDAFVIGHSGTLIPLKNQKFLIELMPEIVKERPSAMLMLLGGGENRQLEELKKVAENCGISERVMFCGGVMNVNEHLSAFDVFTFPSLREGTPLALLEAQANGLPCVVSENIPDDAFITKLIRPISLTNRDLWIHSICTAERISPELYSAKVLQMGYDTDKAYEPIYGIYRGGETLAFPMISLSFDDGRGDNTEIVDNILLPMNIPATLNITSGYVDGSSPEDLYPSNKKAMTVEDVVRLSRSPLVEIALHGNNHQNTVEDILEGRKKLIEWLGVDKDYKFGFASPGSGLSVECFKSDEYKELRNKLAYMRTSMRIERHKWLRVLCRKAGRVIHLPALYRIAYADTMMSFRDGKVIYSVPVMKDITEKQLFALIDDCIKRNSALTFMFHSVLEDTSNEDNWTWSREKFEKFCGYIKTKADNREVELHTTADMFKKMI